MLVMVMQARQLAAELVTIVKQLLELNAKMRKLKVSTEVGLGSCAETAHSLTSSVPNLRGIYLPQCNFLWKQS